MTFVAFDFQWWQWGMKTKYLWVQVSFMLLVCFWYLKYKTEREQTLKLEIGAGVLIWCFLHFWANCLMALFVVLQMTAPPYFHLTCVQIPILFLTVGLRASFSLGLCFPISKDKDILPTSNVYNEDKMRGCMQSVQSTLHIVLLLLSFLFLQDTEWKEY